MKEKKDDGARAFIEEVEGLPDWVRAGTGIEELVRDVKELIEADETAVG